MSSEILVSGLSNGLFLLFVLGIPLYAVYRRIDVFDTFIVGARQGIDTTLKIIPYLVAMLVAIGMLRASGFFDSLSAALSPMLSKFHVPSEILPLALIRPFSGSAANGIMADLIHSHGGNSYIAHVAATIMGSTETTFYVLAVYFGAVSIRRSRHAIAAGLIADLVGIVAALIICRYV